MKVVEISNSGGVTDIITTTDEITIVMGVGEWFTYTYENVFTADMVVSVPETKM